MVYRFAISTRNHGDLFWYQGRRYGWFISRLFCLPYSIYRVIISCYNGVQTCPPETLADDSIRACFEINSNQHSDRFTCACFLHHVAVGSH